MTQLRQDVLDRTRALLRQLDELRVLEDRQLRETSALREVLRSRPEIAIPARRRAALQAALGVEALDPPRAATGPAPLTTTRPLPLPFTRA